MQQQQQQSSVQLQLQPATAFRWREKEAEMQTLQQRLTEREREIGRLKEKLRDLTKKLQQQQQLYNSKVCAPRTVRPADIDPLYIGRRSLMHNFALHAARFKSRNRIIKTKTEK